VECLIKLINENPNGMLVFRDELTGWLKNLDKPSKEGDRQFYLEAWNGNGASFDYDTFTHGHLHCDGLCLTILGTIQPGPLSHMVAYASKGAGGDDGMVQRFQLMVYPDDTDKWRNVDRWPNTEAKEKVHGIFRQLADMTFPSPDGNIPALRFDEPAQAIFNIWRANLEGKVRNESNTMIGSHLAKYRSLMPSLALLLILADVQDWSNPLSPVTAHAATRAVAWCDYLESHARRIYGMQAMAEAEGAKTLLLKLNQGALPNPFTLRQVYRHHWSRLSSSSEAEAVCAMLVDHDYLRSREIRGEGRPKIEYTLNPRYGRKGISTAVPKV
jgi:hypothetical protein